MDHYRASLITVITIRCCCMRSVVRSFVDLFAGRRTFTTFRMKNLVRHDFEPAREYTQWEKNRVQK